MCIRDSIENIIHVNCSKITVSNPDLNPHSLDDKDMILDIKVRTAENGDINIEMQNSHFSQYLYQRFQVYGAQIWHIGAILIAK